MSGDYTSFKDDNTDKTADITLAATDGGLGDVIAVKDSSHRLFIQKIAYHPVTAAAQAVTFQDDNGTPLKIAVVPASQSTPLLFDFGPEGVGLTVGKNLDISNTAGPAAQIHIEAYQKLGAVINSEQGASVQV